MPTRDPFHLSVVDPVAATPITASATATPIKELPKEQAAVTTINIIKLSAAEEAFVSSSSSSIEMLAAVEAAVAMSAASEEQFTFKRCCRLVRIN